MLAARQGRRCTSKVREHGRLRHRRERASHLRFPRMPNDLFRPEVMLARRDAWLGPVAVSQPLSIWLLTVIATGAAAVTLAFLVVATHTRRSTVTGQLVPELGIATVVAPTTGVVSWASAAEGRRVIKGQRLAVVATPRVSTTGRDTAVATERLIASRSRQADAIASTRRAALEAQSSAMVEQLRLVRAEFDSTRQAIQTRQAQVDLARAAWQRFQRLQAEELVSALQADQQKSAYLQSMTELQVAERQSMALERTVRQLEQALKDLAAQRDAQRMELVRDQMELEQERIDAGARAGVAIVAPITGVVASSIATPGQAVQSGQALFVVFPLDARLQAELAVPSSAIAFVKPGSRVRLRYLAFPYQKFGHQEGRVVRVSAAPIVTPGTGVAASTGAANADQMYRVIVAVPRQVISVGAAHAALRPGMVLKADIFGERRRLIEWIFEPFYGLTSREQRV